MGRGHLVFVTRLGPLDGPMQLLREEGAKQFLGVKIQLRAEATAHVWCDDPQLVLWKVECLRQELLDHMRNLC